MNSGDLIALPYVFFRVPIAVLDSKVMNRLPDDSPSRVIFDRQVQSLDRLMRRMLEPQK